MTGEQGTRGLTATRDFRDRANELGAEGTGTLAAARDTGDEVASILEAWTGPELVTAHIRHVVSDPVMGPQLLSIIDHLIAAAMPFEVVLEQGTGAVVYDNHEGRMVVVVATPDA